MDNVIRAICVVLGYGFMVFVVLFILLYIWAYYKTRDHGGIEMVAKEKWEQYKASKEKKSGE